MLSKRNQVTLFLVGVLTSCCLHQSFAVVWPEEEWFRATPDSQGMTGKILALPAGSKAAEFHWEMATPEREGMSSPKLKALTASLASRGTKAFLVARNDKIVCEWYAKDHGPHQKHYTASLAKALVGGVPLAVALSDGLIELDDKAAKYVPQWSNDPLKSRITVRHLGSHTSGIADSIVSNEQRNKAIARTGSNNDFLKSQKSWQGDF